jgi:hypothetical protein
MRQNETKFGLDQTFEFKKSFELYRRTSIRVMMKVAKVWSILHSIDESQ